MAQEERVVACCDLDAFYAQVAVQAHNRGESTAPTAAQLRADSDRVPNIVPRDAPPLAPDAPVAVVQWTMLIAIGYSARPFGVKRGDRAAQAVRKCPQLKLLPVPVVGGKVSLNLFRRASERVMQCILAHAPRACVVEKASIDEVFIELTGEVDRLASEGAVPTQLPPSTIAYGGAVPASQCDLRLVAGAHVCAALRQHVRDEVGYTMSAGIGKNVTIAKLGASLNKPDGQCVVLTPSIAQLLEATPVHKIRWLGGKLGKRLADMGVETGGQLAALSVADLERGFSPERARWLHALGQGNDDSAVVARSLAPKTLSEGKTFPGLKTHGDVRHWLSACIHLVHARMDEDQEMHQRVARTLVVGMRQRGRKFVSRRAPLRSARTPEGMLEQAMTLFDKAVEPSLPFIISGLTVAVTNFSEEGTRTITSLLTGGVEGADRGDATGGDEHDDAPLPTPPNHERCAKCGAFVAVGELQSHADHHLAEELQAEERQGAKRRMAALVEETRCAKNAKKTKRKTRKKHGGKGTLLAFLQPKRK